MKYVLMLAATLLLSACGDDKKAETPARPSAEQRAENPLLKLQDDTVQKAENAVNSVAEKQQEALDSIAQ